jgi:hypothetical protein
MTAASTGSSGPIEDRSRGLPRHGCKGHGCEGCARELIAVKSARFVSRINHRVAIAVKFSRAVLPDGLTLTAVP